MVWREENIVHEFYMSIVDSEHEAFDWGHQDGCSNWFFEYFVSFYYLYSSFIILHRLSECSEVGTKRHTGITSVWWEKRNHRVTQTYEKKTCECYLEDSNHTCNCIDCVNSDLNKMCLKHSKRSIVWLFTEHEEKYQWNDTDNK